MKNNIILFVALAAFATLHPVAAIAERGVGETPTAEMKIMTYNVMHCEGMDRKIDIGRTAARIRAENPDFACLQEID